MCSHINIVHSYSSTRMSGMQTITLCELDKDAAMLALRSLTYAYNSEVIPESVDDTLL